MSAAESIEVYTLIFPDPTWNLGARPVYTQLDGSVFFSFNGTTIVTLSDVNLTPGTNVTGSVYTPDLRQDDPCYEVTKQYIPLNATRRTSLPSREFKLIALAPWISPTCTLSFLESAQQDPINAFVFYLPSSNNTQSPPSADNTQWNLGDNGEWKKTHRFPVFAIPGASGALIMQASSQYSGNLTTVPNGTMLAQAYDPRDYVRLFAEIGISSNTTTPSLWVFLLIVLGILVGVIIITSVLMHCLQRRRRHTLRQRIMNGEVDLEALGIQRLTVPQHILHSMLLYEYGSGKPLTIEEANERNAQEREDEQATVNTQAQDPKSQSEASSSRSSALQTISAHPDFRNYMNQTTCCICLDDFVLSGAGVPGSAVRELPCHHIFHPECVDNFLRENSSLCPMCKHSALPTGYCPRTITNRMVRRERAMRRTRERADVDESGDHAQSGGQVSGFGRLRQLLSRRSERSTQSPGHAMAEIPNSVQTPIAADATSTARPSPRSANRREWARQRALSMLGRQPMVTDQETERRSRWRKVLRGVFPA